MAQLARFTSDGGDKEFVVIFGEDEPDTSEYTDGGFSLAEMVPIDGEVTTFPCDRELSDPVSR